MDTTLILPALQPGDIIAFEGRGFLSNAIGFFTGSSLTHVAMVFKTDGRQVTITESTILHGKSGPQFNDLTTRLATYDRGGRAWVLRLRPIVRKYLDFDAMWRLAAAKTGKDHYNVPELFEYVARLVPVVQDVPILYQRDSDAEVCSEWLTELLKAGGLLPGVDPFTTSPQKLAELAIYQDCVQVLGTPRLIKNFNSR